MEPTRHDLEDRRVAVIGLVVSLVGFGLAGGVWQAFPEDVDWALFAWVQTWRGPALDVVMKGLTHLGDGWLLVVVTVLAGGLAAWRSDKRGAAVVVAVGLLALLLNNGMKGLFGRPRPDLVVEMAADASYAFPSGHALGSTAVWGIISLEVRRLWSAIRWWTWLPAVVIAFVVGLSRVYLGVHWPSDVLAGWSIGAALVFGGCLVLPARRIT